MGSNLNNKKMETEKTPKILKSITPEMLVNVYKPIGTGETSQVFSGTLSALAEALGINLVSDPVWTPIISDITDNATIDNVAGLYSRSGNAVTGMFTFEVQMDAASNSTSFDFTLPVDTVFANRSQLLCTSNIVSNLVEIVGDAIVGQSKGNLSITSANNGDNLLELTVCCQYIIE